MPTPLHWWRLNEQSGTTVADSVGSATGAYVGGPTLGQAESPSTNPDVLSILLDGVDDYVDLLSGSTASGVAMPMTTGTLMCWFKPPQDNINPGHGDPADDQNGVVLYIGDGTAYLQLNYEYQDENLFDDFNPHPEIKRLALASTADGVSGDLTYHDLDTSDDDNDWYHLAITWQDSAVNLYVYGPIDLPSPTTLAVPAASTYSWPGGNAATIRAGNDAVLNSTYWLRGHLCDVKLYDSALAQADIESERDRRDYSPPSVPVVSGTSATGLARAMQGAPGSFQQIAWTKSGAPLDLTGATLSGTIRPRFGPAREITGTLTVADDPTTGSFIWLYSGADVQDAGEAHVQFTATYDARTERTVPASWIVEMSL